MLFSSVIRLYDNDRKLGVDDQSCFAPVATRQDSLTFKGRGSSSHVILYHLTFHLLTLFILRFQLSTSFFILIMDPQH